MRYSRLSLALAVLAVIGGVCGQAPPGPRTRYEPNWASLDQRPLPKWYDKAKVGIFLHFGVYTVPSFGSEWFWTNWISECDSTIPILYIIIIYCSRSKESRLHTLHAAQLQARLHVSTVCGSVYRRTLQRDAMGAALPGQWSQVSSIWCSTHYRSEFDELFWLGTSCWPANIMTATRCGPRNIVSAGTPWTWDPSAISSVGISKNRNIEVTIAIYNWNSQRNCRQLYEIAQIWNLDCITPCSSGSIACGSTTSCICCCSSILWTIRCDRSKWIWCVSICRRLFGRMAIGRHRPSTGNPRSLSRGSTTTVPCERLSSPTIAGDLALPACMAISTIVRIASIPACCRRTSGRTPSRSIVPAGANDSMLRCRISWAPRMSLKVRPKAIEILSLL